MVQESSEATGGSESQTNSDQGGNSCPVGDSATGVQTLGANDPGSSVNPGENIEAGKSDETASSETPATGGDKENQADQAVPRGKVPRRPRGPNLTKRDVTLALRVSKGDTALAAAALGVKVGAIQKRIETDPQLRALYIDNSARLQTPDEISTMARTQDDLPPSVSDRDALIEIAMSQERKLLRTGLLKSGIQPGTIEKLASFDGFSRTTSSFLVTSLDITHRLHIFTLVSLFEQMESIKATYLNDDKMPTEEKIQWQRMYNEIAKSIGRGHTIIKQATEGMAEIVRAMRGAGNGSSKALGKPGWQTE